MNVNQKKLLFYLLAPLYISIAFFMNMTFEWWSKLYED